LAEGGRERRVHEKSGRGSIPTEKAAGEPGYSERRAAGRGSEGAGQRGGEVRGRGEREGREGAERRGR